MKRSAGNLRALILLAVLSSFAASGLAQPAPQGAPVPAQAPSKCLASDTGCVPLAPPAETGAGRPQAVPSGFGDAISTIAHDFASFPSTTTMAWLGGTGGLALAGAVGDGALVRGIDGNGWRGFGAGSGIGSAPAHLGLAFGTFAAGRLSGSAEVSALGFQLIRANLLAQALTHGIKFSTHRVRPDGSRLSFPSGHSSTTFAAATVVHRRYGWKAGIPAYAVASYVAASRVNDKRHYASDVIFGAGLGIAVGLTVTRDNPGRASFIPVPVVTRGGAAAMWTRSW